MTLVSIVVVILAGYIDVTKSVNPTNNGRILNIVKRSPLVLQGDFNDGPHNLAIKHSFLEPLFSINSIHPVGFHDHGGLVSRYKIGTVPDHVLVPVIGAVSSASHTQLHNSVHHLLTHGNMRVPIVVQKISHHQQDIHHAPAIAISALNGDVPTSQINQVSIHRPELPHAEKLSTEKGHMTATVKHYNDNPYRKPIGGYGVGYNAGGAGAGHGYWFKSYFLRRR